MILRFVVTIGLLALAAWPADACHRFHVWNYPWPQRCGLVAQRDPPKPSPPPEKRFPLTDFALPSLEGMEFPPDCDEDWCQRLKGVGLLREKFKTN